VQQVILRQSHVAKLIEKEEEEAADYTSFQPLEGKSKTVRKKRNQYAKATEEAPIRNVLGSEVAGSKRANC
jgi:hypothetical protein